MYWLFLFFICISHLFSVPVQAAEIVRESPKKKMLVFSSTGGYGHQKAAQEYVNIFEEEYDVKVVNWLEDGPLKKYDIVRSVSFGCYSGESFYNFLLKKQWMGTLNLLVGHGPQFARANKQKMEDTMYEYLVEEHPDIIVSVAPVFNLPAVSAAERLSIPYLLTTLDADLTAWAEGLEYVEHPAFAVTIGYDAPKTAPLLRSLGILSESIHTIGFPVSEKFLASYDISALRKKWNIRTAVPCILIMMGGVGTNTAYEYAQKLSCMNIAADVLVCAGKNKELRKKIQQLDPVSSSMKIQALDFVQEIHELMFLAHFLITKGGGMTLYQAIASKTPLLCHSIGSQLSWDKSNIDFIVDNKMGLAITDMNDFEDILHSLLNSSENRMRYKRNMQKYHPINFHNRVKEIVKSLHIKMDRFRQNPVNQNELVVGEYKTYVCTEVSWFSGMRDRLKSFFS